MHKLLEEYLIELKANLKPLPKARLEEELSEMRQHLSSVFARNVASGEADDEAARNAIDAFGVPEVVARETVLAWRRSGDMGFGAFVGSIGFVLFLLYLLTSFTSLMTIPVAQGLRSSVGSTGYLGFCIIIFALRLPASIITTSVISFVYPRSALAALAIGGIIFCSEALLQIIIQLMFMPNMHAHRAFPIFSLLGPAISFIQIPVCLLLA